MIDTVLLQCFLAVAELHCFTKAASRVGRTQSAVSQQMQKLETLLGKTLFVRGRVTTLTSDGELFLNYARRIYALHREAIDTFKKPELEGQVRFGVPEDFASVYLTDVLVDFSRLHPRIFLNIECDLTLNLFERFKRDQFDLVVLKMHKPPSFQNGVNVYHEKLEWVGHDSFTYDSTKPLPLVLSPTPCVYRARAISALESAGLAWRLVFSSPSYAGTIAAVKAGLGVTVLPSTMIPESLTKLRTRKLPALKDTHICLLKQGSSNAALESFEEFVLKQFRKSLAG